MGGLERGGLSLAAAIVGATPTFAHTAPAESKALVEAPASLIEAVAESYRVRDEIEEAMEEADAANADGRSHGEPPPNLDPEGDHPAPNEIGDSGAWVSIEHGSPSEDVGPTPPVPEAGSDPDIPGSTGPEPESPDATETLEAATQSSHEADLNDGAAPASIQNEASTGAPDASPPSPPSSRPVAGDFDPEQDFDPEPDI